MIHLFQEYVMKPCVALFAIVSPFWLPMLKGISSGAALLTPILGTIYLIMQIVAFVRRKDK